MTDDIFLGIDLGTGGARVVAVSASGSMIADASKPFTSSTHPQPGWHEQDANEWRSAAVAALQKIAQKLGDAKINVRGIAVDGTSATIVCVDQNGNPLAPGIMYNDGRAEAEASKLNDEAKKHCEKLGYKFAASFAAAKILWIKKHQTELIEKSRYILHQADFASNYLMGEFGHSDYSNALKTGYDLVDEHWPHWWGGDVVEKLPHIHAPGTEMGELTHAIADKLDLPAGIPICAGASDGTAGFLASGASHPGDDNTTLGTTLVFKRISGKIAKDPGGLIYSHKLPGGLWLPGAASNTGGEWIRHEFAERDLAALDVEAKGRFPLDCVRYPLARTGERFPIKNATLTGGYVGEEPPGEIERYAAGLQGVALFERLCYEALDAATGKANGAIFATGASSHSDVWLQLRADVCGREVKRPDSPESAFGAAVLASTLHFGDLSTAIAMLVRIEKVFEPNPNHLYDELTSQLREFLEVR